MNNLERLGFYYLAGRVFVPKPRFLIYNATRRCDLSCRHCGIWQAEKREELDAARLEPIIARGFFSKVDTVWLTGGEPFLRKDLAELAKVFRARLPGMRMLGIASNGYATERILGRLEELLAELDPGRHGLFLQLSVDGIGEIEDSIRGKAGVFAGVQATIAGVNLLKKKYPERKIELGFNCVIQKQNAGQLGAIKEFAARSGASLTFNLAEITDQYFCNSARAGELALGAEDQKIVIAFLRELSAESAPAFASHYRGMATALEGQQRGRRCLTLYSTLVIDADGSWMPCPLCSDWMRVNFQDRAPEQFWKSRDARELRKRAERELCPSCALSCSLGDSLSIREFLAGGF